MSEWPLKHNGSCACVFVRKEEFGPAEQIEWCGLHSMQREELAALKQELQALREQTPVAYIEYSDDKRQSWYLVYSKSKDRQQEPLYAAPKAQNAPEA